MTTISKESLCELMERFVRGEDQSLEIAGRIEVGLEELFGETEPFADLSLALASYRPGGGLYLYDPVQIVPIMKHVLEEVKRQNQPKK